MRNHQNPLQYPSLSPFYYTGRAFVDLDMTTSAVSGIFDFPGGLTVGVFAVVEEKLVKTECCCSGVSKRRSDKTDAPAIPPGRSRRDFLFSFGRMP